jgi:hypothetical protein
MRQGHCGRDSDFFSLAFLIAFCFLVTLDFKGSRYRGSILPGPTALVVGFAKGGLKVESITDEFSRLYKTQDVMAQLAAVVQGTMDESFRVHDENVNARNREDTATAAGGATSATGKSGEEKSTAAKGKKRASNQGVFKPPPAKRAKATSGGSSGVKRRKATTKKK